MLVCTNYDNAIRWSDGERLEHLFEQTCDRLAETGHGDHPAVVTDDVTMTYGELDRRANQVARYLKGQGVAPGDRVGLLMSKSVHTYVAILAVLKIGAAYVPLDASFPQDRIAYIADDAEIKAIVTLSDLAKHVAEIDRPVISLDTAEAEIAGQNAGRLSPAETDPSADQLCYIIYTSGSTGYPKGVAIEHPSICNFVRVAAEVYGIKQDDRVYQGMTIAFDFSVEELWVPLIVGATLVPGRADTNLLGADLADFLFERNVTALCCVPTLLATIERDLPDLRFILVSGEACPRDLVSRWHRPGRTFLNAYGPTEATVTCTLTELHPETPVTIGGPLPTYSIVVLDEHEDKLVEDGGMGEIAVAGIGLAKGYVNRDDLTEKAFVPDFLDIENNPSKRIYRTGDLGRIDDKGEVEFHGRIDTQVKVRGYRIELTEIESVFMEAPEVAAAVVDTYEPEPGTVELVAYYTLKDETRELPGDELSKLLRSRLPAYMIPGYVEKLDEIPMLPSNKADRKSLPAPEGPRFVATGGEIVAPRNETEEIVAAALAEVLEIDEVSVEDNFFYDLGAHSLLMAQLSAALRERLPGTDLSMRDIYLHPTVAALSELVTAAAAADKPAAKIRDGQDCHKASDFAYYGCGFLQAATYVAGLFVGLYVTVWSIEFVFTPTDWFDIYLRMTAVGAAVFTASLVFPVAAKWLLVGKWTEQEIPVWSLRYYRFWLVKTIVQTSPMRSIGGAPLYNVYLRLLGATIGKDVVIQSKSFPVCTDLLTIGDGTLLSEDTLIPTYRAENGYIRTGTVTLGSNVFVGEGSVLDIDTVMEDGSQLGHASSLQSGQCVPAGKMFHGSPSHETTTNFDRVEPRSCTTLRKFVYFGSQIFVGYFVLMPAAFIAMYLAYTWYFGDVVRLEAVGSAIYPPTAGTMLFIAAGSFALFVLGLITAVVAIAVVPRVLNLFLEEGRTYPLYGLHHFLFKLVKAMTNSKYFNVLLGDSSYIVHFLKCVGYDLSNLKQTGSNFGTNQKHDNPFLCKIGTGTMVSDGLAMMNCQMSSTSFRLGAVHIRENSFVGNIVHYPPDGKTGENCLLASRVMIPIDGPVRENVGLLGSPAFEIPRSVERDKFEGADDPNFVASRLPGKNARNVIGIVSVLAVQALYSCLAMCFGYAAVWLYLNYGMSALFLSVLGFGAFTLAYFVLHAQWSLTGKRMEPKAISIYEPYFWSVEHYWKRNEVRLLQGFGGTPFKNLMSRMLGVKVGRKVFDDGCFVTEKTMAEIGDYCTLNASSCIQCHSLEDAFFKSDYVVIGNGCTIGHNAYIQYGAKIGDNALLETDAYLMKGEVLDPNSTWQGNPARPL